MNPKYCSEIFPAHNNIRKFLIAILVILPVLASAQFERKISVNVSGGLFRTIGPKEYPDPYYIDFEIPYLMPNFQTGWTIFGGIQYNISRKFSLEGNLGFARSGYWYYEAYDPDYNDYYCWMCWEIYDEYYEDALISGEDYLTLFNLSIGFAPKYYFLPSKRINPYALVELNFNYTSVDFIDSEYEAYVELGREDEYGESASETWMEKSFGLGFSPVVGTEFSVNDNIGIFFQAGYWMILLNKNEFEYAEEEENFHALKFQLGVRMSFWKSKEL
jgi:hypothetical protein